MVNPNSAKNNSEPTQKSLIASEAAASQSNNESHAKSV